MSDFDGIANRALHTMPTEPPEFILSGGYGRHTDSLTVMVTAVLGAGKHVVELFYNQPHDKNETSYKSDRSPVTQADNAAQQYLMDVLLRHYPNAGVDGEEGSLGDQKAKQIFRFDPLDGTQNFTLGMAGNFSVVLGEYISGKLVGAVVYEPINHILFVAGVDRGSRKFAWNGTRWKQTTLKVEDLESGIPKRRTNILLDTKAYDEDPVLIKALNFLGYYTGEPLPGSALKVSMVAERKNVCGMFRSQRGNPDVHDVAVASLLVTEAGGIATSLTGGDMLDKDLKFYDGYIIAAPKAHADIQLINTLFHKHLTRLGVTEDDLNRKQVNDLAQVIASEVHAARAQ